MFSFDLKSGHSYQRYLGFSWTDSSFKITKFNQCTVLRFELSTARHIYTEVLTPQEKHYSDIF